MVKKQILIKIEYQTNVEMFILDYDNLIYKKTEINYDDKFKSNKILKGKIKEKYLEVRIFFLKKEKDKKRFDFFFKKN